MITSALAYRGYRIGVDVDVTADDHGERITAWDHADPQPTPEQLAAWAAEPGYQTWLAEHGGDPEATARREAAELVDGGSPIARAVRALAKVLMDEIRAMKAGSPRASREWAEHKAALKDALRAGLGDD